MNSKTAHGSPVNHPVGGPVPGKPVASPVASSTVKRNSPIADTVTHVGAPDSGGEETVTNPFEEASRSALERLGDRPPEPLPAPDPRLVQLAGGQIPDDLQPHPDRPIPTGYPSFGTLKTMSGRPPAAATSMNRFRGLGVFKFLLISGATGLVAFGLGSGLAVVKPLSGNQMPLIEQAMRSVGQATRGIQSLPEQWAKGWAKQYEPKAVGIASSPLQPAQRAQLETNLIQLQGESRSLADRLKVIETQLGYRYDGPLDDRLRRAAKLLMDSRIDGSQPLSVSLPTDSLFEDGESVLKPSANLILDTLVGELMSYDRGLVSILAHTDNIGSAETNRELSLRRAQSVMTYLRDRQGGNLQWLAVGQGASQPIAKGQDNTSHQRNRRLEISVDPR
jgi:OmpA-OmpF porin, OOP family